MSAGGMTLATPDLMTADEARRITERIRTALDRVATGWADLAERVTEAYERRADLALGYPTWESYASAELRPSEGIAAEVRRELVGLLSARGMSTRAIAPTVGVQHSAVAKDLRRAGVSDGHTSAPERIDYATGEVLVDSEPSAAVGGGEAPAAAEPLKIVGLDGKTYTRPTPTSTTPARRPLRDGFRDAALDLDKIVGRFQRLVADDRYPRNRDEVARFRNDLIRARDALDRLVEQMSN